MEKEQILSELKAKIGTTSLSERTLTEYVNLNLPAEGTEPDESYWTKHTGVLKSLGGQYSHDIAESKTTLEAKWKEEWEKSHPGGTGGKGNAGDGGGSGGNGGGDATNSELLKRLEALEQAHKEAVAQKNVSELRLKMQGKAEGLKVANKALWNDAVGMTPVGGETTEEKLLEEVKKTYEAKLKAYMGDGAQPYGCTGDPHTLSDKEAEARREAYKERLRKSGKLPKREEK